MSVTTHEPQRRVRKWLRPWGAAAAFVGASVVASPCAGWQFTNLAGDVRDLAHDGTALYATGSVASTGSTFTEMAVLRLDPASGAEVWRYVLPSPNSYFGGGRVVTTPAGDVVAGEITTFRIAKVAGASGTAMWIYEFPGAAGGSVRGLALDSSGDVIAAGATNSPTPIEFTVVKISGSTGTELWRYTEAGTGSTSILGSGAEGVVVDAGDDVIAVGKLRNAGTLGDFAVAKLDGASGAEIWRTEIDGGLGTDEFAEDVVVDDIGDVIASGVIQTPTGASAAVKLAGASGAEIWRDAWSSSLVFGAIERDSAGALVVAAFPLGLAKLDPSTGVPIWSVTTPSLGYRLTLTADDDPIAAFSGGGFARYAGTDGQLLWRREVTGFSDLTSIVAPPGDQIFVSGGSNGVTILGLAEGVGGRKASLRELAPGELKLAIVSKDPLLFAPSPGGPNDPSAGGATFELRNPVSAESTSIVLPAAGWVGKTGKKPGAVVWKYADVAGVCRRVRLLAGKKLTIKCLGDLGFSLDEPSQGNLVATLAFAGGHRHCMSFGGVVADEPGRFVAKNSSPIACPD
jgi:hypothetical protein